jgi:uncharacterized protein (TIGR03435 family)
MDLLDGGEMVIARMLVAGVLAVSAAGCVAQDAAPRPKFEAFDVATIKRTPEGTLGRFFKMDGTHRWIATNFTLKEMIGLGYDLNPKTISGGPAWMETVHFDIEAVPPGDVAPNRAEQMRMLRSLLTERFKLTFHRRPKEYSIYELTVAKGGPKLKESTAAADAPSSVINVVYPQSIKLPARNATMEDFVAMLGRAALDRPVVDKTGLKGRYDFDLEWAPDSSQFGGAIPEASSDASAPPLFTAVQEQLGLKLEATRGPVQELVVDGAAMPVAD